MTNSNNQIYLVLEERLPEGLEPDAVFIYASTHPIENDEKVKLRQTETIQTRKSSLQILGDLEKLIKAKSEKPSVRDVYTILPDRVKEDSLRFIGYLAYGSWPKIGQTQEQAEIESHRYNYLRNKRIQLVFKKYIESCRK